MRVEKGVEEGEEEEGRRERMRAMRDRVSVRVRVLSQSRRRWVRGKGRRGEGGIVVRWVSR